MSHGNGCGRSCLPEETVTDTVKSEPKESPTEPEPADVIYENCDAARADVAARAGKWATTGFLALDRNGDGVSCEP